MRKFVLIIYIIAASLSSQNVTAVDIKETGILQNTLKDKAIGEKIAFWAEQFVGKPYDTDPLGEYVRKEVIVTDERVDCMYHVFRSVELASTNSPENAISKALDMRFHTKGILRDGMVTNYNDRFEYGEDMILSGKWGKDITGKLGKTVYIKGSRGLDRQEVLLKQDAINAIAKFKSGDIVFFIKDPEKRMVGEIVGHIGIIKSEVKSQNSKVRETYLIHASGTKGKQNGNSGSVKKGLFTDYLKSMKFIGIKATRFEE